MKIFDSDYDLGGHHKPRKIDKKKHHKRGYNEDSPEKRKSRVNFKKYLNELRESDLEDYDEI